MDNKLCFFIIAFSVALLFGETSTNYYEPLKYSFQIKTNGLQDISSLIPGTMISFKKMTNSMEGLRITAGISGGSYTYIPNGTTESKSDSFSIALYITKLKYAYRNKNLYLYYGYGPFGKYSYQLSTGSYEQITTNYFSGGLNGCLGIEWFFSKQFSLFAEYSLNATASYGRISYRINGSNLVSKPTITKGFNLNSNSVLIGLSIYL